MGEKGQRGDRSAEADIEQHDGHCVRVRIGEVRGLEKYGVIDPFPYFWGQTKSYPFPRHRAEEGVAASRFQAKDGIFRAELI